MKRFRPGKLTGILGVLMLSACARPSLMHLVVVPDLSRSIERRAENDGFRAIGNTVRSLDRGDRMAVIPITGFAENDDEGNISRFEVPLVREPFDGDLARLEERESAALGTLRAVAVESPYKSTDILGSVNLAAEEFSDNPSNLRKFLVVLSDFIQDDRNLNFRRDRRLAGISGAQHLAVTLAMSHPHRFAGVHVYLGGLSSTELRKLSEQRRVAIRMFWETFLTAQGAEVEWATDGPGRLDQFIRRVREQDSQTTTTTEPPFSKSTTIAER